MGARRGPARQDAPDESGLEKVATLADAARALHRIAAPLGASDCAVLAVAGIGERARLVSVLDGDHPGMAPATRLVIEEAGTTIAAYALRSSVPCCWSRSAGVDPTAGMWGGLAAAIAVPLQAFDGVVFPVFGEQGRQGVAVFTGERLVLSNLLVCDAHLSVARLFNDICRLRMSPARGLPVSKRELECLRLAARGLTSDEIAAQLGLSVHTANQYLANTTQKLDAVNRMHAVAKAMRLGLID